MTVNSFPSLLKAWRTQRGFSQLSLALASRVSQRHISFLESGRSKPSREMILRLATTLDIPFRDQNTWLTAAGFAPIFAERDLSAPDLSPVRQALDFMLQQQEPYPAIVMDRYWNQLESNRAAQRLMQYLLDPPQLASCCADDGRLNLITLMFHPDGLRSHISDWPTVATVLLQRVYRESVATGENSLSADLFQQLLQFPDVEDLWHSYPSETPQMPLLMVTFQKEHQQLTFFSTLATLGTPYDITLQELRIEYLFPGDRATAAIMQHWPSNVSDASQSPES